MNEEQTEKKSMCSTKTEIFQLGKLENKKIELSYSGADVSSDGGALLLKSVEEKIGIIKGLADCINDKRDSRYITHSLDSLLGQRVYQISCGYEDGNDCDKLRSDSIFKICNERLPDSGEDLGSQPTISRLENSVDNAAIYKMGEVFLDKFVCSYAEAPEVIIIDCDDTNNKVHGGQQQVLFNGYYKEYCYQPLHIYEGFSGKLITTVLKPGCRSNGRTVKAILGRIIRYLSKRWPNTRFIIRGDSHFTSPELMSYAEEEKCINYLTGLAGNPRLSKMTEARLKKAKETFKATGFPQKTYHSFWYKADSWDKKQKVVAKIEYGRKGGNVRYVVSDLATKVRAKELYEKGYCARGAAELRIKDHKLYLKSDRSSCNKFIANQFRLFLHSAAYVLIHTMQKELMRGTEYFNATMETIQLKILKTAAIVREKVTKIKIEFPASCSTKDVQIQSLDILYHLNAGFT